MTNDTRDIARYYDEKTNRILDKYGAGLRVHYHTGLADGRYPPEAPAEALRDLMAASQERVMDLLAAHWPEGPNPLEVLDVGCGLGGGALYWAQERQCRVTAITVAPEHVAVVRDRAAFAGVASRVEVLLQDAHTMPGTARFDIVVAVESTCYLNRGIWLTRVADLLRPGGSLHVFDWLRGKDSPGAEAADAYWKTTMGTLEEYRFEARNAGLRNVHECVLNDETAGFWTLCRAWNEAVLRDRTVEPSEKERLSRSSRELAALETCYRRGDVLSVHMVFQK